MKIACDVCVSDRTIIVLEHFGFSVVVKAEPSESDESWFDYGLRRGAKIFISQDYDIGKLVAKNNEKNLKWVVFPETEWVSATDIIIQRLVKIRASLSTNREPSIEYLKAS